MDLYGPTFYPEGGTGVAERFQWAKKQKEAEVNHHQFRQFFAVHETEAWLLSTPGIFPPEIKKAFPPKIAEPETINFNMPPAKMLGKLYDDKLKRTYKKVVDGADLFAKLDPSVAYDRCPYLRMMLDEMLRLAQEAGL